MKKIFLNISKILIYITFFVPLVVVPSSFIFPFIVPKILLFRTLVLLAAGCYVLLLAINWQEYKPKFTALNLVLICFLVSFSLSTVLGTDPYHSFWDNHERMLGLFTIIHYVLYYFICSAIFKDWKDWQTALKIFIVAGSVVMFIGLLQVKDPNFLMNRGDVRVASTLGNAIYVSGYGLFILFSSCLLFLKEKNKKWKVVEVISALLGLCGIFFGGSRGAIIGLVVGLFFMAVTYGLIMKENYKIRKIALSALLIFVCLGGLAYFFRSSKLVSDIPAVGRLLNTSLSEITGGPRVVAWQIAIKAWQEKPILGWGPNNYFYAFNKYYNPRSLEFGYGETWFDNAHNIILNTLAVQGGFGLLIYLSIFAVAVLSLYNLFKNGKIDKHLFIVGSAFLVAHLVQNATVFENPTSYMYFMFWLAMVNCFAQNTENIVENKKVVGDKKISQGLIVIVSCFVFLLVFIFNIQPARANMLTLNVLKVLSNNAPEAVDKMKEALAFSSPHIDDIRSDISRTAMQILSAESEKLGMEKSMEIYNVATAELEKNLSLHPKDIRNHIILAQLSQVAFQITKDPKYIQMVSQYFQEALPLSPHRQQLLYGLATIDMAMGKTEEAARFMNQTIADDPKISESYWRLAYIYYIGHQNEKAKETIFLAQKNDAVFDDQGKSAVASILAAIEKESSTKK